MALQPHMGRTSSFLRFLDHSQWHITVGRTPLCEWSARSRDLCCAKHNTPNRQTFTTLVEFEPTFSSGDWPQTCVLDCMATGNGCFLLVIYIFSLLHCFFFSFKHIRFFTNLFWELVTGRREEHVHVHEFIDNATEENLNRLRLPNTVEYISGEYISRKSCCMCVVCCRKSR